MTTLKLLRASNEVSPVSVNFRVKPPSSGDIYCEDSGQENLLKVTNEMKSYTFGTKTKLSNSRGQANLILLLGLESSLALIIR